MTDDDLLALREGMNFLDHGAKTAPIRRREAFNRQAARNILPRISTLTQRGHYDHVLEAAAQAGAVEIICALPIRKDESLAHLTSSGWENLAHNLPAKAFADVEARGLIFDWAGVLALSEWGDKAAKDAIVGAFGRQKWRIGDHPATLFQNWSRVSCTDTAVGFLKSQIEAFPEEAAGLYAHHQGGSFIQTLLLECFLGLDQTTSLNRLIAQNPASNHQTLAVVRISRDPRLLHKALQRVIKRPEDNVIETMTAPAGERTLQGVCA